MGSGPRVNKLEIALASINIPVVEELPKMAAACAWVYRVSPIASFLFRSPRSVGGSDPDSFQVTVSALGLIA